MSFDKPTRNLLAKIVARCRDRLADDIADQLQSAYGLHPDGTVLDVARTEDARRAAEDLRALWEHFEAAQAGSAAVRQTAAYPRLVREIGFTTLNRLAALRLCEERGLVVECVRRGMASDGFQLYDRVAGGALGNRYGTYRAFLQSLFDELALDLGVLFDRGTPQSHVFPSEAELTDVLAWLNDPELAARDVWQQDETIGWIYQYYNDPKERKAMRDASNAPRNSRELAVRNQFFTPRYVVEFLTDNTLGRTWYEMRRGNTRLAEQCRYLVRRPCEIFMDGGYVRRDAHPGIQRALQGDFSGLPEEPTWGDLQTLALMIDGYDLAPALGLGDCGEFANARMAAYQETGRWTGTSIELWMCLFFEQRRWHHFGYSPEGEALATIQTLYAALRETLANEQITSSQEELLKQPVYIPPRSKKDPRDLRILDPACGSGHFLLYAFDLLTTIYKEAWDAPMMPPFSETGTRLADDYPNLEALRVAAPGLILRHNLHGIDIDPRAVQIAALALWLRAQRAYQDLGLAPADRPRITRSNLVTAEPMPGDRELLDEFTHDLRPRVLGDLVRVVFEKMELAGEAGSLLRIEEELAEAIAQAHRQWAAGSKAEQMLLFPQDQLPKPEQPPLFDVSGITDEAFWETAEVRVLQALRDYATRAENGKGMRRRLFAEDAAQGFAFVDLYQQRFDVVLMNPPFGEPSESTKMFIDSRYRGASGNILCAFIKSFIERVPASGLVGSVVDRTILIKNSYESFRRDYFLGVAGLSAAIDLGWGVLDANVEVSSLIVGQSPNSVLHETFGANLSLLDNKELELKERCSNPSFVKLRTFRRMPFAAINFEVPQFFLRCLQRMSSLNEEVGSFHNGHTIKSDVFKRLSWEVSLQEDELVWDRMWNGSDYSPFHVPMQEVVLVERYGGGLSNHRSTIIRNPDKHKRPGLCFGKRGDYLDVQALPEGFVLTNEGFGGPFENLAKTWFALSLLNSCVVQYIINLYCGQHKGVGYVGQLPFPGADDHQIRELSNLGFKLYNMVKGANRSLETDPNFLSPRAGFPQDCSTSRDFTNAYLIALEQYHEQLSILDNVAFNLYGVSAKEKRLVFRETVNRPKAPLLLDWPSSGFKASEIYFVVQFLSYYVGCVFGRWDIRVMTSPRIAREAASPFDPPPVCPPGMLLGPDGLPATPHHIVSQAWLRARPDVITLPPEGSFEGPATIRDDEYPIRIAWDGVLVDDPGLNGDNPHPSDIVRRARQVLAVLWPKNHDAIEAEACEILGVRELRDYFRKPAKFFADHLKRYSKSRRKAPIYWPLSTASGSYTLWLYYHHLDDQILYTAVNRYVTPRIERVEAHVARLEAGLAQTTGRAASGLRDQLDDVGTFLAELREFRAELLRLAGLPYKPDLNDGVIINAAPLHKLFRLRRWAQDTGKVWRKLEDGDYDWAHMAYTLWPERVREVCKHDRSIAIAHGLEELCEVPEKTSKKKGKKRKKK